MIERPPSIRPPAGQLLIAGTALGGTGAHTEYVFEVTGARKLSLDWISLFERGDFLRVLR